MCQQPSLSILVERLISRPQVWGLVRYGRRMLDDNQPGGDLDLYVFLDPCPQDVESLHFFWGDIPVDLGIRGYDDLERSAPLTAFDRTLIGAQVVYDATGKLEARLTQLATRWPTAVSPLREHDGAWHRFCHRHLLDKVRYRLNTDPLLCRLLLNTNIYWLIQTYFSIRERAYPGERAALCWLEQHEPEMVRLIQAFYRCDALPDMMTHTEQLTDLVLRPLGGTWRETEVLTLGREGNEQDLQRSGQRLWEQLLEG